MKITNILLVTTFFFTIAACEILSGNRSMEIPQTTNTGSGNNTCPTTNTDNTFNVDVSAMNLKDLTDLREMLVKIAPQKVADLKIDDVILADVENIITNALLIDDKSIGLGFWNSTNSLQAFISVCGLGEIPVDQLFPSKAWLSTYNQKVLTGFTTDQLKAALQTVNSGKAPMETMSNFSNAASFLTEAQASYIEFATKSIGSTFDGKLFLDSAPTTWLPAALCYICDGIDAFSCSNDAVNELCKQVSDSKTFFATQIAALQKDMELQKRQRELRLNYIKQNSDAISAQLKANVDAARKAAAKCKQADCDSLPQLEVAAQYAQQALKAFEAGIAEYAKEGFDDTYNGILNQFNADRTQINIYQSPCADPNSETGGAK